MNCSTALSVLSPVLTLLIVGCSQQQASPDRPNAMIYYKPPPKHTPGAAGTYGNIPSSPRTGRSDSGGMLTGSLDAPHPYGRSPSKAAGPGVCLPRTSVGEIQSSHRVGTGLPTSHTGRIDVENPIGAGESSRNSAGIAPPGP